MHKGSSSDPLLKLVGAATIGRALGISGRRVTQLRDEGRLPGAAAGKFKLGSTIAAYCSLLRPAAGRAAPGNSEAAVSFDAARTRLLTEQADAQAMRNGAMRGQLIPEAEIEDLLGAIVEAQRQGFLRLPSRAAPLLAGKDAAQITAILSEFIYQVLDELAALEFVVVDGKLTARRRAPIAGNSHG